MPWKRKRRKRGAQKSFYSLFLAAAALFQAAVTGYLLQNPDYYQLRADTCESSLFRSMKLGEGLMKQAWNTDTGKLDMDVITAQMIAHDYNMEGIKEAVPEGSLRQPMVQAIRARDYKVLKKAYETILGDIRYFPIPGSGGEPDVSFSDSWMAGRTYVSGEGAADNRGSRGHEGCDLMGDKKPRGYYPIVSMTDGVIERVGWLEMGGWRMGIRAPGGAYFYYAHLYGYEGSPKAGDKVKAGQIIGYMGDSGYGKEEGTVGKFEVHLHLGIYFETEHYRELSVNPYWILKYLENRRVGAYWHT